MYGYIYTGVCQRNEIYKADPFLRLEIYKTRPLQRSVTYEADLVTESEIQESQ